MGIIPAQVAEDIKNRSKIEEVVADFVDLKKAGKGLKGICPFCGEQKGFSIDPAKQLFKCFKCSEGGKGAVAFIQKKKNIKYPEALKWLGDRYRIIIPEDDVNSEVKKLEKQRKSRKPSSKNSFRDEQLKASGLTDEDQRCKVRIDDNTEIEINRYQNRTRNEYWDVVDGDDMVMWYVDLHGKQVTYMPKGKTKPLPLFRVRYQIPELHKDKHGTPMKYQSPFNSGSPLWIPNITRYKFENRIPFDTLYIQEGEKKADKATKHGMISVGIMGIHNIAYNKKLPHEFEMIIKTCKVKNVVFVVDSDYQDISENPEKNVDARPRSFLSAVRNFRDHFKYFYTINIVLDTFFAHVKPEHNHKGIDDLLTNTLAGKEKQLTEDFEKTMHMKDGQGEYINCFRITAASEPQLQELFHLKDDEAFIKKHREKLEKRGVFRIGRLLWRFNEKKEPELAQPLMPDEQYWAETETEVNGKLRTNVQFHYGNCYNFLRNHQYGRYKMSNSRYKFIRLEGKVVTEVEPYQIKDYVMQFTKALPQKTIPQKDLILEKMYRGAKMYLGPDSLSNLEFLDPLFDGSDRGCQSFYYQNTYWRITADGIEEKPINELDAFVWDKQIVSDVTPQALPKPMFDVTRIDDKLINQLDAESKERYQALEGGYSIDWSEEAQKCDFALFLMRCSDFYHDRNEGDVTTEEKMETNLHFLSKLTAIGYLLHRYRDSNVLKAVVAQDGIESEVGSSNGRTGKSLIGEALSRVIHTVYVPGKSRDLTEDKFIWEEVDERTQMIFIDDTRVNIDFEFFFPAITGKLIINAKGEKKFAIPRENTPKIYLTTNHALNGSGSSFRDRQHLIAFSDYYSDVRKPIDEFKKNFFDEWDYNEWSLFYNFMATCLQLYFKFGLVAAPTERLEKRRLRQQIGEDFLEWADLFYSDPDNVNHELERKPMLERFWETYPKQRNYVNPMQFKKRLKLWCVYKGYIFNPYQADKINGVVQSQHGGDIKKGGVEYFKIKPIE